MEKVRGLMLPRFAVAIAAMAIGLASTLAGCATAPMPHEVENTRSYEQDQDIVWQRAVSFFAEHNLSIKTIDKASGIIAADRQINVIARDMDGYADCGKAPMMRIIAQSIDLNLFLRRLDDRHTSVTVNTRFTETRMLGYNMMTTTTTACVSTGKLEDEILTALRQSL